MSKKHKNRNQFDIRSRPKHERVAAFMANPLTGECSDAMFFALLADYGLDIDDIPSEPAPTPEGGCDVQ